MLRTFAIAVAGIVLLIIAFLVVESVPALRRIGLRRFFTDAGWSPDADAAGGAFSLTAIMVGTVATTAGAVLLAGPLGVLSAMYGRFYAPGRCAARTGASSSCSRAFPRLSTGSGGS